MSVMMTGSAEVVLPVQAVNIQRRAATSSKRACFSQWLAHVDHVREKAKKLMRSRRHDDGKTVRTFFDIYKDKTVKGRRFRKILVNILELADKDCKKLTVSAWKKFLVLTHDKQARSTTMCSSAAKKLIANVFSSWFYVIFDRAWRSRHVYLQSAISTWVSLVQQGKFVCCMNVENGRRAHISTLHGRKNDAKALDLKKFSICERCFTVKVMLRRRREGEEEDKNILRRDLVTLQTVIHKYSLLLLPLPPPPPPPPPASKSCFLRWSAWLSERKIFAVSMLLLNKTHSSPSSPIPDASLANNHPLSYGTDGLPRPRSTPPILKPYKVRTLTPSSFRPPLPCHPVSSRPQSCPALPCPALPCPVLSFSCRLEIRTPRTCPSANITSTKNQVKQARRSNTRQLESIISASYLPAVLFLTGRSSSSGLSACLIFTRRTRITTDLERVGQKEKLLLLQVVSFRLAQQLNHLLKRSDRAGRRGGREGRRRGKEGRGGEEKDE
eukprot:754264-Hanusia_phi.AAC.3